MKKINIAITMNLEAGGEQSIFFNGGNQHCVFLYFALKKLPFVRNVWLCGNIERSEVSPQMFIAALGKDQFKLNDIIYDVDLVIDMNSNIGCDHAEVIHARKGRCVAYRFGNEYAFTVEACSLNAHAKGDSFWIPNPNRVPFDAVWTNPQHENSCRSFFEAVYRAPVEILSHLWSPYFIDQALEVDAGFKANWPYRNVGAKKKIGIYEPNINVVKSSIIPMIIADRCFSRSPDLIEHIFVTNTLRLAEHPTFRHFALSLPSCQSAHATVEPRFPFVAFAAEHSTFVLSHQWENGLNYLFYEALYGGFPLIHNSNLLGEAGYKYSAFDAEQGADVLERALRTHDDHHEDYAIRARDALWKVSPKNPAVVREYGNAIRRLFA